VLVDVETLERPCPHAEATAYFFVAEALTNISRHANAREARVEIRRKDDQLIVTVTDDGVGGADAARGTGLLGLRDRLAVLEGTPTIDSAPGAGTRICAAVPAALPQKRKRFGQCALGAPIPVPGLLGKQLA
jgi:signal transduction histidine kinase